MKLHKSNRKPHPQKNEELTSKDTKEAKVEEKEMQEIYRNIGKEKEWEWDFSDLIEDISYRQSSL